MSPYAQATDNNNYGVTFGNSGVFLGSNIEKLLKNYVSGNGTADGISKCKLNLTLVEGETARLMTKGEAETLNGSGTLRAGTKFTGMPEWIKDITFWLSDSPGSNNNWGISTTYNCLDVWTSDSSRGPGLRPVLVVNKSRLSPSN